MAGCVMINVTTIILAAACVALNVTLGTAVFLLKLPIYLDSVGIMLAALLVQGSRPRAFVVASMVAIASFMIGGLIANPFLPWFISTGIAGAAFGAFIVRDRVDGLIAQKAGPFAFGVRLVLFGVGWGVLAALVSAPVVVYLFGGVTGSGTALIVAFFVKTGQQLMSAAILSGLTAEPVDKTLQLACAVIVARWTPAVFRKQL